MKLLYFLSASVVAASLSSGASAFFFDFWGGKQKSWSFSQLTYPVNDADFRQVRSSIRVANSDKQKDDIRANVIIRTGQKMSSTGGIFGAATDITRGPVFTNSTSNVRQIGFAPDFVSVHPGPAENKFWLISQIEAGPPGQVYRTLLEQNPLTGSLSAIDTWPVDFTHVGGVWIPCAGSLTKWGTHLGSEEYEPDARAFAAADDKGMEKNVKEYLKYFQLYENNATKANAEAVFNPYRYGHSWELRVSKDGKTDVKKRYAMGRLALELYSCAPDKRTCYAGDDGDNTMLTMFVADKPEDMASGTLYGGKMTQSGSGSDVSFKVDWIKLGHASEKEIENLVDSKVTFADIFETAAWKDGCPEDFKSANGGGIGVECLKLKPGMEKAAAFLETRRYAGTLGVTTEWNKMEGISYSEGDRKLFLSLTAIRSGMEDERDKGEPSDKYDKGRNNDIRMPYNPCGCVFQFDYGDDFRLTSGKPLICGTPMKYPAGSVEAVARGGFTNTCDVNKIANPDNLFYVEKADTLLIYEDSSTHTSNTMWAYHLKSKQLTRVATNIYSAEFSGANYQKIGDYGYILYTVQAPYSGGNEYVKGTSDNQAYVGYIGPFEHTAVDFWKSL